MIKKKDKRLFQYHKWSLILIVLIMVIEDAFFVFIAVLVASLGMYVYLHPGEMIELQKKFYAKINWRMEPISLQKEIRNTKAMGLFLILFVLTACLYVWIKK